MHSLDDLKKYMRVKQNIGLMALFLAVGLTVYPLALGIYEALMYDDRPALVYHYCAANTTEDENKTQIVDVTCVYNKRPNCEGDVTIGLELVASRYKRITLIGPVATTWEDAVGFSKTAETKIPVPPGTIPGIYNITAKTKFTHCAANLKFGFGETSPRYTYRAVVGEEMRVTIK